MRHIDEVMGKQAPTEESEKLLQKLSEMQKQLNRQQSFREQLALLQKNTEKNEPKENKILNLFK